LSVDKNKAFRTERYTYAKLYQDDPVHAAMIKSLDESLVRVMDGINALGLNKKAVIIFMSDNGGLSTWKAQMGSGDTSCSAVRMGDYKLIKFYEEPTFELFKLKTDSYEKNNIACKTRRKRKPCVANLCGV